MRTQVNGNRVVGWVMSALVLTVLPIGIYLASSDHGDARGAVTAPEPIADYVPDELRALLNFVDSMAARGGTARGHEFTALGVRSVAAALGTVATSAGLDFGPELETIREHATRIERDPRPRERTAHARLAFLSLAALLEAVQRVRFRELEPDVANVSRAASSLRAEDRLFEQRDVVQEFFKRAAAAIDAMNHELFAPHQSQAAA